MATVLSLCERTMALLVAHGKSTAGVGYSSWNPQVLKVVRDLGDVQLLADWEEYYRGLEARGIKVHR